MSTEPDNGGPRKSSRRRDIATLGGMAALVGAAATVSTTAALATLGVVFFWVAWSS